MRLVPGFTTLDPTAPSMQRASARSISADDSTSLASRWPSGVLARNVCRTELPRAPAVRRRSAAAAYLRRGAGSLPCARAKVRAGLGNDVIDNEQELVAPAVGEFVDHRDPQLLLRPLGLVQRRIEAVGFCALPDIGGATATNPEEAHARALQLQSIGKGRLACGGSTALTLKKVGSSKSLRSSRLSRRASNS